MRLSRAVRDMKADGTWDLLVECCKVAAEAPSAALAPATAETADAPEAAPATSTRALPSTPELQALLQGKATRYGDGRPYGQKECSRGMYREAIKWGGQAVHDHLLSPKEATDKLFRIGTQSHHCPRARPQREVEPR